MNCLWKESLLLLVPERHGWPHPGGPHPGGSAGKRQGQEAEREGLGGQEPVPHWCPGQERAGQAKLVYAGSLNSLRALGIGAVPSSRAPGPWLTGAGGQWPRL